MSFGTFASPPDSGEVGRAQAVQAAAARVVVTEGLVAGLGSSATMPV
ncbi:MAG TPA: hypothetical protein VHC69_04495 [Polyangiaceae bacterium]|nr:hypothetical protein [Polyangiaceae bacterium]